MTGFKERASDLHRDCVQYLRAVLEKYDPVDFDPDADPPIYQLNETFNHDHVAAVSIFMYNGEPRVTANSTDSDALVVTNVVDLNTDELVELVEYVDELIQVHEQSLLAVADKVRFRLSMMQDPVILDRIVDVLRAEAHTIKPLGKSQ